MNATALMRGDNSATALGPGDGLLERVRHVAHDITLRVQDALDQHEAAPWPADDGDPDRPLRVLCVDDHEDAADALAVVAESLGCQTRVCYDGPTALRAVREFRPDACLLDLMMPGMDGLEVAGWIRSRAGTRPLLLVATTALGSLEDRTATALAGFHFHLVKPITITALRAALERFREVTRRGEPGDETPRE